MIEDPGRGYRRAVPSYPAKEIIEMVGVQQLVEQGDIVIAGGGGDISRLYAIRTAATTASKRSSRQNRLPV